MHQFQITRYEDICGVLLHLFDGQKDICSLILRKLKIMEYELSTNMLSQIKYLNKEYYYLMNCKRFWPYPNTPYYKYILRKNRNKNKEWV